MVFLLHPSCSVNRTAFKAAEEVIIRRFLPWWTDTKDAFSYISRLLSNVVLMESENGRRVMMDVRFKSDLTNTIHFRYKLIHVALIYLFKSVYKGLLLM